MPQISCHDINFASLLDCCSSNRKEMISQVSELIESRPKLAYLLKDDRYITSLSICGKGFYSKDGQFVTLEDSISFDPKDLFKYKIDYSIVHWDAFVVFN